MPPPDGGGNMQNQKPTYDELYAMWVQSQSKLQEAFNRIKVLEVANASASQQSGTSSHSLLNPHSKINGKRQRTEANLSSDEEMSDEENPIQPKSFKPPPLFVSKNNANIILIKEITSQFESENIPEFKTMSDETLKIQAKNEFSYRKARDLLNTKKLAYHTHQLKSERPYRVVIRGLHPKTEKSDIVVALAEFHHIVRDVVNVTIRKRKDPSNRNSDKVLINLPLFFVSLEPSQNNKDIYDLTALLYQRISVEAPYKKNETPQCKNYQQFGHTRAYCKKSPKCVKCAENHSTEDCKKPKKTKAKCANCSGDHTANWKGCDTYQKAQKNFSSRTTSAVDRIQENPTTETPTLEKSFASVAKKAPTCSAPETSNSLTPPFQSDKIIDLLQSIQQSITNLDLRLMKLEKIPKLHSR